MQVSFYVLADGLASTTNHKANDTTSNTHSSHAPDDTHQALLAFVCKLTQTVLKKSEQGLIIIDDDFKRLALLDAQLWTFDAASFIPHSLILPPNLPTKTAVATSVTGDMTSPNGTVAKRMANAATQTEAKANLADSFAAPIGSHDLTEAPYAPVVLTTIIPTGFDGVVLNLAKSPLTAAFDMQASISPERILEIIAPDATSKAQGREKYKYYQSKNCDLTHHPIG